MVTIICGYDSRKEAFYIQLGQVLIDISTWSVIDATCQIRLESR